jgi:hypothetical protein
MGVHSGGVKPPLNFFADYWAVGNLWSIIRRYLTGNKEYIWYNTRNDKGAVVKDCGRVLGTGRCKFDYSAYTGKALPGGKQ